MKPFKNFIVAVLMAAMSVTLLTACGGSGSAGMTEQTFGEKYTIQYTLVERNGVEVSNGSTMTLMTDGTCTYSASGKRAVLTTKDASYVVNPENKKALKQESDATNPGTSVTATTKTGTKEYKGKTYTTETAVLTSGNGKVSISYCFYNGQLEYMIQESAAENGQAVSSVFRIDSLVKSVDESKLDIENYEIVNSFEELGFMN